MRSDFLRILFQWLLDGTSFTPDSSTTKPPTNTSNRRDEVRTRFDTYELHDFRFTRHDNYPKRHAFLIVTHGNLQLGFLAERKLSLEGKPDVVAWANRLHNDVDQRCIEDLAEFCAQSLEAYLEETNTLRRQRVEALTAQHVNELARETETPSSGAVLSRFMWHSVALDRLRGVIIGDVLSYRNNHGNQSDVDQQQYKAIMACFIKHLAAFQQSSRCMNEASTETSPELPSGIPPLKLDVDNPDTLFLREQSSTEAGADISVEDTNIFPQPRWVHEEYKKTERARREVAEHVTVRGQAFWIIASCYETLEFFSIVDTALPLDLLEHEMNRLYAFGGAEPAEQPEDK
ncbi:hypothetical protein BBO99_00003832 [Phytophthora kernoviae]|uniref:Uncharacterized protein n=2 Tax=Phytophthora kernoviae TaxID=325452 RepID=A0A3R7JVD1_9STRA|nr:hypothetical protein G195_004237 [Phytophthora kernoviae 00238/432]KAG2528041.1 hypothetical protein JM16_003098 [Phytophthora kernoviae]KAG2528862.1 hypothetical protein JM18_003160 [Phytophthora kernoviae]RLN10034.1 hypothetical protein BBI17_003895 [Phytophthora kernoviae]RLN81275.1 hypothetical protein BBO99_00003832 [Phytophthora kernoviae]